MQEKFIYIADDLTGACDVASFISDYSGEAEVVIDYSEDEFSSFSKKVNSALNGNFVISTNTRDLSSEACVLKLEKLGDFLREFGNRKIFKKIDSAFRGNVVLEINTLMSIFNKNICFLINSIPSMDRITLNGFQLIKGKILSESEFSKDPVKSVKSPFIPMIFSENNKGICFRKATHINLEIVRYGDILGAVENAVNDNVSVISFDSAANKDIYKINNSTADNKEENLNIKPYNLKRVTKSKGNDFLDKFVGFSSSKYKITKKQVSQ